MRQIRFSDAGSRHVRKSGFSGRQALGAFLDVDDDDLVYLVEFRYLGNVTVNAPPLHKLSAKARLDLAQKLNRMDERSGRGPWACRTLALIDQRPGTRGVDVLGEL